MSHMEVENLTCETANVLNLSMICLKKDHPDDCFPEEPPGILYGICVIHVTIVVLGIVGNLLTLLAIPYAM